MTSFTPSMGASLTLKVMGVVLLDEPESPPQPTSPASTRLAKAVSFKYFITNFL
ncbi:hypothetical protein VCR26J2_370695 [Vibrio coralliirubri]|nr:hypothetical protein VCR26J2_370695 [Vibrio coralliirubri]